MMTFIIANLIGKIVVDRYPITENNVSEFIPAYNKWAEENDETTYNPLNESELKDMDKETLISLLTAALDGESTDGEYISSEGEVLTAEDVSERITANASAFIVYALAHRSDCEEFESLYKVYLKKAIQDGIAQL